MQFSYKRIIFISETLDKMAFKNSFHLIGQGTPNVRYFFPVQKAKLASMLCDSSEDNLIYTRHMYYTDRQGALSLTSTWWVSGTPPTLIMLNTFQMRDPVDRFVSRYNYYREVLGGHQRSTYQSPVSLPLVVAHSHPIPLQRRGQVCQYQWLCLEKSSWVSL